MLRWEYLRLTVVYHGEGGIDHATSNGHKVIQKEDNAGWKELQNYLDTLGAEGWEMVSMKTSNVRTAEIFYFKRPIESE
jgi:hypothetical protein